MDSKEADKVEEGFKNSPSADAFEEWRAVRPSRTTAYFPGDEVGIAWEAWEAGAAYQRAQDLEHVEAVRASFDDEQPFDWIAARITAEEPGKGEG